MVVKLITLVVHIWHTFLSEVFSKSSVAKLASCSSLKQAMFFDSIRRRSFFFAGLQKAAPLAVFSSAETRSIMSASYIRSSLRWAELVSGVSALPDKRMASWMNSM